MLDISFGTLTCGGTKDDSDDFSRWDSIRIACWMDFINDVLYCWIMGIETLNRLSRGIVGTPAAVSKFRNVCLGKCGQLIL